MMSASDKLRQEMMSRAPFGREEFINRICELIKHCGKARFICDKHIRQTNIFNPWNKIRIVDEYAAIEFARSEGFSVSYDYNGYGVRYIVFTL